MALQFAVMQMVNTNLLLICAKVVPMCFYKIFYSDYLDVCHQHCPTQLSMGEFYSDILFGGGVAERQRE